MVASARMHKGALGAKRSSNRADEKRKDECHAVKIPEEFWKDTKWIKLGDTKVAEHSIQENSH